MNFTSAQYQAIANYLNSIPGATGGNTAAGLESANVTPAQWNYLRALLTLAESYNN